LQEGIATGKIPKFLQGEIGSLDYVNTLEGKGRDLSKRQRQSENYRQIFLAVA